MRTFASALAILFATGCTTVPLSAELLARDSEVSDIGPYDAYEQAARVSGVPTDLLIAISHVETRMQMVVGESEFPGQEPAFGLMGLRGANLEAAAELAGVTTDEVATLREENVMGTALLLAEWADEMGIDTHDLNAWAPVVARYSGIEEEEAAAEYVHFEVYDLLSTGLKLEGLTLTGRAVSPDFPAPNRVRNPRMDDSTAIWSPSPNKNSRSGRIPEYVVIHTCEGTYSGCWGWLVNSASKVSAHYVVNDSGSEVRQLVDESDRAWHASANYDCGNNSSKDCSNNGTSMNTLSVGIEHAGYASQSSWSTGLIQRSAELTCGITQRNNIPRDSYHIIGHGQIQPWNRTDPGPNWPWTDYLNRIKDACGDTGSSSGGSGGSSGGSGGSSSGSTGSSGGSTGSSGSTGGSSSGPASNGPTGLPTTFVIDSNNGANTSDYWIDISGWTASANVGGYYNTGYWWRRTSSSSNLAAFTFVTDADVCYKVEAWWSAASDRSPSATFIGMDENDNEVGRGSVNQRINGGAWNMLGTWQFPAGTNRVSLSNWGDGSAVVIADAVRLTEDTHCN